MLAVAELGAAVHGLHVKQQDRKGMYSTRLTVHLRTAMLGMCWAYHPYLWQDFMLPDSQSSRCLLLSRYAELSQQAGLWGGSHLAGGGHSSRVQGRRTPHSMSHAAANLAG